MMRRTASGLIVLMAALFLWSGRYLDVHPAWGYLHAFAEAAMVGGLADCESGAIEVVLSLAEARRLVTEEEWKASGDPAVSVRGAKLLAQELLQNPERRARAETRAGALADEGRSDA